MNAQLPLIIEMASGGARLGTGVLVTPAPESDASGSRTTGVEAGAADRCAARVDMPAEWVGPVWASVPTEGMGWQAVMGIAAPRLSGQSDAEDQIVMAPAASLPSQGLSVLPAHCFDFHGASACVFPPPEVRSDQRRGLVIVLPPALYGADRHSWWEWVDAEELSRENVLVLLAPPLRRDPLVFSDHQGGEPWGQWIEDELIPRIEADWSTDAVRAHRVLAGFSSGGLGALLIGLLHPEAFGTVVAVSPDAPILADWLLEGSRVRQVLVERARLEALLGERAEFASYAELYGAEWPFELGERLGEGGELVDEAWKVWNRASPLGVLSRSRYRNALRGGRSRFVLSAGSADEYGLFEATQHFADELRSMGIAVCWAQHGGRHTLPTGLWRDVAGWARHGPSPAHTDSSGCLAPP